MENSDLTFEKKLSSNMSSLNRDEVFRLCLDVCNGLEQADLEDGCHGGIWPGNISIAPDGTYVLGPSVNLAPGEMAPDQLEYIAPETFWDGRRSSASDVYSVGLLMYTACNKGVQPFMPESGEAVPADRANALRQRMKGMSFDPPGDCDDDLQKVIMRAMSYNESERFSTPAELAAAVHSVFIPIPVSRSETSPKYTVEKDFEPKEPEKPQKKAKNPIAFIILLAVIAAVIILLLCLKSCSSKLSETASKDPPVVSDTPSVSPDVSPSSAPEVSPAASLSPNPDSTPETADPTGLPETSPDPETVSSPTPVITDPVIGANANSLISENFTMVLDDCTWEDAQARCEKMGGHLATISDQDDLNRVITMAETLGAQYVWLGAKRESAGGDMVWVTGEDIDFYIWDTNEPSYKDGYDGTAEDYLMLWNVSFGKHNGWAYNDSRLDPIAASSKVYSGKVAYICEFD